MGEVLIAGTASLLTSLSGVDRAVGPDSVPGSRYTPPTGPRQVVRCRAEGTMSQHGDPAATPYRPRATLRDVAAMAGVSIKTVSRVVNGENGVTRDLEMDYGDFVIEGRLVGLTAFEPNAADCTR